MVEEKKEPKPQKQSSSLPYIIVALFVFGLSLVGAFSLWRFTLSNLRYFTAEKLSIFVLVTGVVGSIFLFRLLYMFAISRDVERRRRETVRNQLSATVLSSIGDGVVATNTEKKVVFMNEAMRSMMLIRDDVYGKLLRKVVTIEDEQGKVVPENKGPVAKAIELGKRVATTVVRPEYYFVRSDKRRFPGMVTATPVMDHDDVAGAVLVVRDVTREKEIDQAKSEFVSLASHQLRTPISMIRWYVESLIKGRAGKINKEQEKYLKTVYEGGERMADLVNALLNVSRIELGTFAIEPEETSLKDIAESVLKELEPTVREKKLEVTKRYDKELGKISVDKNLIRIIFQNLLSNAVKYTPPKGKLALAIEKRGTGAQITVSDTGYGIPKAEQERIFGKLFRATNAKEKDADGNGLGLYIVKSILDHSGGKVWFESPASGQFKSKKVESPGTTFYVTIPLKGMKKKEGSRKLN